MAKSLDDTTKQQIGENLRLLSDTRYKQLTILMAWLTVAGGGVAQFGQNELVKQVLNVKQALAISAILFISVFWIMEVRSTIIWRVHRSAAPEVWPRLKYDRFWWINASHAVVFLNMLMYFAWLWFAWQWNVDIGL